MSSSSLLSYRNRSSPSNFSTQFEALYTAIKSPLSLLFSKVWNFSLESLSSFGKFLRLGAILQLLLVFSQTSIYLYFYVVTKSLPHILTLIESMMLSICWSSLHPNIWKPFLYFSAADMYLLWFYWYVSLVTNYLSSILLNIFQHIFCLSINFLSNTFLNIYFVYLFIFNRLLSSLSHSSTAYLQYITLFEIKLHFPKFT